MVLIRRRFQMMRVLVPFKDDHFYSESLEFNLSSKINIAEENVVIVHKYENKSLN